MKKTFLGLTFLLLLFTQCAQQRSTDFRTLAQQPNTAIIDVRTVGEFEAGHIPQSINIPLPILLDSAAYLQRFSTLILICRSGNRSGQAKVLLQEKGFENVHNGGGWEKFQQQYLE